MKLLIDIILLCILFGFTAVGVKNGFIKTALSCVKNIVAFIAALIFAPGLGNWLNEKFISRFAEKFIGNKLSEYIADGSETAVEVANLLETKHPAFAQFLDKMNVDTEELEQVVVSSDATASDICNFIAKPFESAISSVIAFVLVFVAVLCVMSIISAALNLVAKLPLLKGANKLFGGALGLLLGVFWAVVVVELVKISAPYCWDMSIVNNLNEGATLYNFIKSTAPEFLNGIII